MIIIVGTIEAIRKAAARRKIDLPPEADGMAETPAPFMRRRLSQLYKGQIFRHAALPPAQAVLVAELDQAPLKIVFPEADGDTEISLSPSDLPKGRLADFLSGIIPSLTPDPWRGNKVDIRA